MDSADLATMAADIQEMVDDDPVSIEIVRGEETLVAQTVTFIKSRSQAREYASPAGETVQSDLSILGNTSLDIQRGDRFVIDSIAYEVIFVDPDQSFQTLAEARILG